MKTYQVELSQNGWEYTGHILIKCSEIEQTGLNTIVADGVVIEFDEEIILDTEEIKW